jgi:hypothetical protein
MWRLDIYNIGGASSLSSSNLVFNSRFFFGLGLGAGMMLAANGHPNPTSFAYLFRSPEYRNDGAA